jgi:TPR repeat protein
MKNVILMIAMAGVIFVSACADLTTAKTAYRNKDYDTARAQWIKLAEYDYPEAQSNLGLMMIRGEGGQQNIAEGLRLLEEAGNQNYAPALLEHGKLYQAGKVVPADKARARKFYEEALSLGYMRATYQLGTLAESEKNYDQAEMYYRQAAQAGVPRAQEKIDALLNKRATH